MGRDMGVGIPLASTSMTIGTLPVHLPNFTGWEGRGVANTSVSAAGCNCGGAWGCRQEGN